MSVFSHKITFIMKFLNGGNESQDGEKAMKDDYLIFPKCTQSVTMLI